MSAAPTPPVNARRAAAKRRRRRLTTTVSVALVLAVGGYVAAVALAPLPELKPELSAEPERQASAPEEAVEDALFEVDAPTAIAWADGERVWANTEKAFPIASITKLVTVLVGLEAQPLKQGEDGPSYTYSAADRQREGELRALDAVMYPVPVGTRFTTRELMELMLIPSANDYAIAYANWVFGSNKAYVAAVEEWAEQHGLKSLRIVEPSGLDDGNRASVVDLARLARIALKNPTVLEFTRMKTVTLPIIGEVRSTNPLLGEVRGVIGLKTGALDAIGYNLLLAQKATVDGRRLTNISVTLGRPSLEARAASGREMLEVMAGLPQRTDFAVAGEELGSVTTWQGQRVSLVTSRSESGVLLPGESFTRSIELAGVSAGPKGSAVGGIRIDAPGDADPVPVVTAAAIAEPDLMWRILHPWALLG